MPVVGFRTRAIARVPATKRTPRIAAGELATTASRAVLPTQALGRGWSHVTTGPATTRSVTFAKRVFGMMFVPVVLTFFDSSKSDDCTFTVLLPGSSFAARAGSGKTAIPVTAS